MFADAEQAKHILFSPYDTFINSHNNAHAPFYTPTSLCDASLLSECLLIIVLQLAPTVFCSTMRRDELPMLACMHACCWASWEFLLCLIVFNSHNSTCVCTIHYSLCLLSVVYRGLLFLPPTLSPHPHCKII